MKTILGAIVGGGAALLLGLGAAPVQAQNYPTRQVNFISSVGGGVTEAYLRNILDKMRENTGTPMIFDPRLGGAGAPALQATKAAKPDGYTFSITYASAFNLNPLINKELGIDPLKDFVAVSNLMTTATSLGAAESFPGKDIRDVVTMSKAKPGSIRVGMFSTGNQVWLTQLEERAGIKLLMVPYKTPGEVMGAISGGFLDIYIDTLSGQLAQKGKFKVLVSGGTAPVPGNPGIPLMRDLYNFDMMSWYGIVAATGTPQPAVNWAWRELVRAIKDPKLTESIEKGGLGILANSPEEFTRSLRAEIESNADILRKYPNIK